MIEHNLGVSVAQSFALKRLDMDFFWGRVKRFFNMIVISC